MKHTGNMQAMVLEKAGGPLVYRQVPIPQPSDYQVLIKIIACGICRTDLHILDGELDKPKLPLIPGHEIIGTVVKTGGTVTELSSGQLVGVPWLGHTCGRCKFCLLGMENLCDAPLFTGYTIDGGYSEYTVADARFCFILDKRYNQPASAPLLCAGLIGFRSYSMIAPSAKNVGFYGFGAAAHILIQVAIAQGKQVFAFTRDGDERAQRFAKTMGAHWVGGSSDVPSEVLDAAIIFAAAGELIPKALKDVGKGGQVICGGIHMSNVPEFPYSLLWGERSVKSVANLTRQDGLNFFSILKNIEVLTQTKVFRLFEANEAINQFRSGQISGAAVLVMNDI
ncbi:MULTISPECIES: zinc-dependent alcohol dehydrogenase family protein [Mucilaginibacter]|uniref:Zinc-dependent alcohol dehydrogenase family protein n=2 Tax=Mucilaginibacter rubeus TaxID=2027860 RepID=A0ABX7U4D6_9SPHI|nr:MULTISPECIES: zinc-dependent alcohol dehydrogenase family protein [Mucilaginibacter]QTE41086.1 zinc-dependent alcohol dehydrogenase family protein [Mucilaginibacter rubeus]QTE47689.1 zinc-dependent alcohol dehydrogenase family protein [Mucilaginibacter rubeus]QTE59080.1 zinc-dependent alcohol dehydrogenase family protein [Mucilaginibacter rubeus]QTE61459.1 zinc-dependent alcohol dehydrogenase family protein [Mucilaginibacter rubeus]QTF60218.1 zinc-dependent alcohol dehydrogenase family prot